MGKYDFIKLGNLLYWHDPDSGCLLYTSGESGSQRKHVIARTVWIAIPVEILECSCVRDVYKRQPFLVYLQFITLTNYLS